MCVENRNKAGSGSSSGATFYRFRVDATNFRSNSVSRLVCVLGSLALGIGIVGSYGQGVSAQRDPSQHADYVGSELRARCHKDLYDRFEASPMGRSMSLTDEATRPMVNSAQPVVSQRLNRRFSVEERYDGFYQRKTESEPSDKPPFDILHKLDFAIGSGVNGYSFLVRRGNHLVQAPISYYSRKREWGLPPGYEFAKPGEDYGFNRTIHTACLQCHAGRPASQGDSEGLYGDPPFAELAIGCENCHGPGREHADARLADGAANDGQIVHPLKLDPRLAENICMNCHQGGDACVLQPSRGHFDFRPGEWLNDTFAILKLPMDPNNPQDSDLLEHNASMELSRCFRASQGSLSCFSCHEIHTRPSEMDQSA